MVVGLQRFRDHFRAHGEAFVLIGGAACDAWMTANALAFRRTKDLDIVLVADAVDAVFAERFKTFVDEGGYEVRQRQETGKREFFRFYKPKGDDYPFMLELFSRAPAGLDVWPGQQIVPVPVDESVASLSAILMDEGYYGLVLQTRYVDDDIPMVAVAGLIPLKAKAWLDLQARRGAGQHVDEDDIKKHRNDIFRLALTYEADGGPGLVEIARVLQASVSREEDLSTLLRAQLLFWMLAATDGHAKNFSIRLLPQGRYRLTPLYDVLSAWPVTGSRGNQLHPKKIKLAMALRGANKHYRILEMQRRHFNQTAKQCGLGTNMETMISDVISRTPSVIESVAARLPDGFPPKLFESVTRRLRKAADEIAAMPIE